MRNLTENAVADKEPCFCIARDRIVQIPLR